MTMTMADAGNFAMLVEQGLRPEVARRVVDQWAAKCGEADNMRATMAMLASTIDGMSNIARAALNPSAPAAPEAEMPYFKTHTGVWGAIVRMPDAIEGILPEEGK